jgi:hypothetical protein
MFREEARETLTRLRVLADEHQTSQTLARLEEWRRSDLQTKEGLVRYASNIADASEEVQSFLHQFATTDDEARWFKGTVQCLQSAVDELNATRRECMDAAPGMAEKAAAKVMAMSDGATQRVIDHIQLHTRKNEQFCNDQMDQWSRNTELVNSMKRALDEIVENVEHRTKKQNEFEATQCETLIRIEAMVDASNRQVNKVEDFMDKLEAALLLGQDKNTQRIENHLSKILGTAEGDTVADGSDDQSVVAGIAALRKDFRQIEHGVLADVDHWQTIAHKLTTVKDEMVTEAKSWESKAERNAEKLRQTSADLALRLSELEELKGGMKAFESNVFAERLRELKEIETRGNIKMNRQTGEVELLRKEFDYKPVKTDREPAAEFKDADAAKAIAHDVNELAQIFNVPLSVEVHLKTPKGQTPEFWQRVAERRAELFRDAAELPGYTLTTGLVGKDGLNIDCLIIRVDKGLFPAVEKAAVKNSKKK